MVGGFERVFELGQNFRNEGISTRHNPEFTMLEFYEAYADYTDTMERLEELVAGVAHDVTGATAHVQGGRDLDLTPPWRRATMAELVSTARASALARDTDAPELATVAPEARHLHVEEAWGPGSLAPICAKTVETLGQPIFVIEHPAETSPLARRHRDDPALTRAVPRPSLLAASSSTASRSSPIPMTSVARFEAQAAPAHAGDDEASMVLYEEFLRALGARAAAHGRDGARRRSAGHAADRLGQHPRGHRLPHTAARRG